LGIGHQFDFFPEFPERFGRSHHYHKSRLPKSMSVYRLRERRQRACECLAMAKQASDAISRAFLVEMAWKWLDLAELDEWDNWEKALRLRAIQTNIGRELRAQFDLPQGIPHLALLMEIDSRTTDGN
jgi:hypothetical protein